MPSPPCSCAKISSLLLFGIVIVTLGALSIPFLNRFVKYKVSQEVPLREPIDNETSPSVAFKFWKDIPVPMYMSFRFFHVENPLEILSLGEKPVLTERGPYVYTERRHKKDIVFSENGTLVSFREVSVFHFVPEMSVGDENDEIRLLNVPFVTVLNQAKDQSWFKRQALKVAVTATNTQLFEIKSVHQWTWGYNDSLLELLKLSQPDMVPFTYFGWFMNRNNSDQGQLTIRTGLGDVQREAEIVSWQNRTSMDVWTDSFCNAINGTDGTMFHPFIQRNESLYMFTTDICRSIYASYEKDTLSKGINAFKFVPPPSVFANGSVNPDNDCFCVPDTDHCLGAGVLNISKCQFGAPVVSSSPHLFQADPQYLERLKGLHPSKDLHQTYLNIEPVTGMVLDAAKRLQVNAFVDNIPTWSNYFQNFPDKMIFPIVWFEEKGALDDHTAATIRGQVTDQLHLVLAVQVTLFAFGGFWILAALLLVVHKLLSKSRRAKRTPSLEPVEVKSASSPPPGLAYDNPMDWQSPLHEDRTHPVASYGAFDQTDVNANASVSAAPRVEVRKLGRARDGTAELSINSKPGLPDWLAKISG